MQNSILNKGNNIDYLVVTGSTLICSVLMFGYNILIRRFITPYDLGMFTSVNLVSIYMNYLQMGVLNSYARDYPQLLGQGDYTKAEYLKDVVLSYISVLYFVSGLLVSAIVFVLLILKKVALPVAIGLVANTIFSFFTVTYSYLDNTLKSDKKFLYSSIVQILKTVAYIVIGALVIKSFKYYGLLFTTGFSILFALTLNYREIIRRKFCLDKKLLLKMTKDGLPLLVNGLVWTSMMSIDKFVILYFMPLEAMGTYSVAILGFSTIIIIPQSITQIFYIEMSRKFGANQDSKSLIQIANTYTLYISLITNYICIISYFVLPGFISTVMPLYSNSVRSCQILIIGVAIYSTTLQYSNVLSVLKLNSKLLSSTIALSLFTLFMTTTFVLVFGKKIENVAIGTSLSYAIFSIVLIYIIKKNLNTSISILIKSSILPVLISIISILLISRIFDHNLVRLGLSVVSVTVASWIIYPAQMHSLLMKAINIFKKPEL